MTPTIMHQPGLLHYNDSYARLGELMLGIKPGRENDGERIHYSHIDISVDDISLAYLIYQNALQHGLGIQLSLWKKPFWI